MATAVRAALSGRVATDPRDVAAERLALTYAELMDDARPAARFRRHLEVLSRAVAGTSLEEDDPYESFQAITTALAETTVVSDLGPKLMVTLGSLGLTAASRGEQRGEGKKSAPGDPLDELKRKRAERNRAG